MYERNVAPIRLVKYMLASSSIQSGSLRHFSSSGDLLK